MVSDESETETLADVVWRVMERHARGVVLRLVDAAPCRTLNAIVLRDLLDAFGMCLSHERLDGVLAWLQEQRLARIKRGEATVVSVTARGADLAEDRVRHNGIARSWPKSGATLEATRNDEEAEHLNGDG